MAKPVGKGAVVALAAVALAIGTIGWRLVHISADNEISLRLHRSLGFLEVGRLPEVGRKFDRWLDLVLVQLTL